MILIEPLSLNRRPCRAGPEHDTTHAGHGRAQRQLDGARGRDRTGTTAKSRDFLATSAFAAGPLVLSNKRPFVVWSTPSP